jgi:predicted kinase
MKLSEALHARSAAAASKKVPDAMMKRIVDELFKAADQGLYRCEVDIDDLKHLEQVAEILRDDGFSVSIKKRYDVDALSKDAAFAGKSYLYVSWSGA